MSFVHTVRNALAKLRYPKVDASGNLLASVTPRTGTVSTLLGTGDAGDGEVATATDEDCLVVYRGTSPSIGKLHFGTGINTFGYSTLSYFNLPISTPTQIPLTGTASVPSGLIDTTNGVITAPAYLSNSTLTGYLLIDINYRVFCFGLTAGADAKAYTEYSLSGTWGAVTAYGVSSVARGDGSIEILGHEVLILTPAQAKTYEGIRIFVNQDGATTSGGLLSTSFLSVKTTLIG